MHSLACAWWKKTVQLLALELLACTDNAFLT